MIVCCFGVLIECICHVEPSVILDRMVSLLKGADGNGRRGNSFHCEPTVHISCSSPQRISLQWRTSCLQGGQAGDSILKGPSRWHLAEVAITMENTHDSC